MNKEVDERITQQMAKTAEGSTDAGKIEIPTNYYNIDFYLSRLFHFISKDSSIFIRSRRHRHRHLGHCAAAPCLSIDLCLSLQLGSQLTSPVSAEKSENCQLLSLWEKKKEEVMFLY